MKQREAVISFLRHSCRIERNASFILGAVLWFASSCAKPDTSGPFPRAPLIGGENTVILHCSERGFGNDPRATLAFEPAQCDPSRLRDLEVSPPPSAFTITPECQNGLVHITSHDFRFNKVVSMDALGSFSAQLQHGLSFEEGEEMSRCTSLMNLTVRGTVSCADWSSSGIVGAVITTEWIEDPESQRPGCPTTLPCVFTTQTALTCPAP